jgi:transposase
MMDHGTGEVIERRLQHEDGEARAFYAALPPPARVGMQATGHAQWFERMLAEQGHQLWVGDAAQIRAVIVRKQKTDSSDALHLLDLLLTDRFPRILVSSPAERDVRQLLRHRHNLVHFRASVGNQLRALAFGQSVCGKNGLWTIARPKEQEGLTLGPWDGRHRKELLKMLDRLNPSIDELDQAVKKEAESRWEAVCFMQQRVSGPGDGAGVCAHSWPRGQLPQKQAGDELSGTQSEGTQ